MIKLQSSYRERTPEETIEIVRPIAKRLGITRVTDTTQLDIFGVPVYASIRPNSKSLCVNAGKGMRKIDAKAGAYMEAIEFAFAEYGNSDTKVFERTPLDLYPNQDDDYILDFCPMNGIEIDLEEEMGVVEAINILDEKKCFIPAEIFYMPCPEHISRRKYFGSDTNGLSSGNSFDEAALHGMFEVIERDIDSFNHFKNTSILLNNNSLPSFYNDILERVEKQGFQLHIRYAPNELGIPHFSALLATRNDSTAVYNCGGVGCHVNKDIALNRSITEAFQSRLSFIHGGRDDVIEVFEKHALLSTKQKDEFTDSLIESYNHKANGTIDFHEINSLFPEANTIDKIMESMKTHLAANGFDKIIVKAFTQQDYPIQVVKVCIPKMEYFDSTERIGKRLRAYISENED